MLKGRNDNNFMSKKNIAEHTLLDILESILNLIVDSYFCWINTAAIFSEIS
jgi:hypothetical protein